MCPWAGKKFPSLFPAEIACHCLLIETNSGLILVDTGLGTLDLKDPRRLGSMSRLLGISNDCGDAAINQIIKLGFSPSDVRHIIPTHLDVDHAGGIVDFPNACVHTLSLEYRAATSKPTFWERERYRHCHWPPDTKWVIHEENYGEPWFGFNAVREIPGVPPEILIIPLLGHTRGHFGVAVQQEKRWLLHAGDAYYDHRELGMEGKPPAGLQLFQRMVHIDYQQAKQNQKRLQELSSEQKEVEIFCAHDVTEFQRMSKIREQVGHSN